MQPLRNMQNRGGDQHSPAAAEPAARTGAMHPAAAVLIHSVLLPERFSGHAAFHLRYPVSRDSPEPHPLIVLSAWRTPESFTPSADLRRFPISFHCRYSVITIVASYHTSFPLSTASFSCKTGYFLPFSKNSHPFCLSSAFFLSKSAIFHGRTNVFLYTLPPRSPPFPPENFRILPPCRHFQRFFRPKGTAFPFSPLGPLPFVRRRSTIKPLHPEETGGNRK